MNSRLNLLAAFFLKTLNHLSTQNSRFSFPSTWFRSMSGIAMVCTIVFSMGLSSAGFGQVTIHTNNCSSLTSGWVFTNGTTTNAILQSGYWLLEDNDIIISQAFDVSSYTGGVVLSFTLATYGTGSPDKPILVEYSTDNGTTWSATNFTSATPSSSTYISSGNFNISSSLSTQFKFRFKKASTGGRAGVRLDNILFNGIISNFSVTYNGNGNTSGTAPTDASSPYTSGSMVTVLGNTGSLIKTGNTFSGWTVASDGSGTVLIAGSTFAISANTTLYAKWTPTSGSNVTFNANGGTGSMPTQNASSPTNLTSNAFTRTGYTFTGWNTASNGSGTSYINEQSYDFSADLTLFAQWSPINNTLSFNNNGGAGSMASQTVATDASITLPGNTFTRTGYTFAGWSTTAGGAVAFADGASYTMGTSDATLFAVWNANTYIVTFNGNGSDGGSMANQNYVTGATANLTANAFTRTGYTFSGWNTSADGSGTSYANSASYTMGTANVTLYAQWVVYVGPCLSENFNSGTRPSGWTDSGSGITYGSNYIDMSVPTGTVTTVSISNPNSLTFNLSRTTNMTAKNLNIEVSTTSSTSGFSVVTNFDHTNTTSGGTVACTVDLSAFNASSTVFIRFNKTSGITSPWRIDDVQVFCAAPDPALSVSSTSLTNLNYTVGFGPSAVQTFNLTGTNLDGSDVDLVLANTDFEISSNNTVFSSSITLPAYSGASQPIYVRLKSGLAVNSYSDVIMIAGGGVALADEPEVNLAGTVSAVITPVITSSLTQSVQYGGAVSYQITANNTPTSFGAINLPTGLSINASGLISGTITANVGTVNTTITATNSAGTDSETLVWTITPKALTISGLIGNNRVYDGNTTATLSGTGTLNGIVGADAVTLSGTPLVAFANATVGNNKPITVTGYTLSGAQAGNYTLTQPTGITANITPKALSVTGATAQDKVYDGNTTASITGATLVDVISPDVVTISGGGTFASANAGTGIAVSANLTLAGAQAGNYTLTQPTGLSANITKANPVFTTSTISITLGGTYSLPGSNISSTSDGVLSYTITSGGNATLAGTTITGAVVGSETLTVNQAASANYNAGSTTVVVNVVTVSYSIGDYRTNPSFTGTSIFFNSTSFSSGIAPWQMWDGTAWVDVVHIAGSLNAPQNLATKPENIYLNFSNVDIAGGGTFNNIYIQGGYVFSGNTATGLTIASNKILDIEAGYFYLSGKFSLLSGSTVTVRENAEFEIASSSFNFTRNASSNFIVEDNAFVYINNYLANVWGGNENFSGDSYFIVYGWSKDDRLFENQTDISNNSLGSKFGYLEIEIASLTDNWGFVFPAENFKLTNRDFLLANNSTSNVNLNAGTMEIGGDFIINGTGNVQMRTQSGLKITNVTGNFVKNGSGQFRLNSSTDIVNLVELNVGGNFTINAGGFSLDNGATANLVSRVNLKGNLTKTISSQMLNSNTNSSLVSFNFTGGAAQTVDLNVQSTIDMVRYRFFVKSGAYVRLVNQDWKIATDSKVTVENGGTLDFGWDLANVPLKLIINNSQSNTAFELQDGGTLVLTSTDIQGAITANGINFGNVQTGSRIYHPTGGSFVFKGLSHQYYRNSSSGSVPSKCKNLTIDNGTQNVYLGNDFTTWNVLDMKGGHIWVESTKILELGENTTNKGTLSYTSGFVNGRMRRWFASTNSNDATGLFPMGQDVSGMKNRFTRVYFTTAPSTGGHLTVEYVTSPMGVAGLPIAAASTGGFGLDVTSTEDQGYWKIDNQAGTLTDGAYTISCTGEGFSTISALSGITLLKRVGGGNWFCPGAHVAATGNTAVPTVSRSGVSGWSNFGFGGDVANPLPVELLSFNAGCAETAVELTWSTGSETNSDQFILERSRDVNVWNSVAVVDAAGNSTSQLDYQHTDENPFPGVSYYRLRQIDFNGNERVYGPISVNCSAQGEGIEVYPNPASQQFTVAIALKDDMPATRIQVLDVSGKIIATQVTDLKAGTTNILFDQLDLPAGTYMIHVVSNASHFAPLRLVITN